MIGKCCLSGLPLLEADFTIASGGFCRWCHHYWWWNFVIGVAIIGDGISTLVLPLLVVEFHCWCHP
ncbi:hypothetical protein C2G38_2221992 [Gigaspora rosea]|uniref:Uncharacterized protein n=1 Tax=Gigaspora rosea TaxID=44941 RepID=A0A397U2Y2_9GLOM|nr:hypothetical protein C2G38_2221992 [Gigaspora rosea]